ncbi:unnamed protein product, partial [Angiostrongylus costaricensis]|uniref:TPR_REGION domain-containing protein n=1 Tax=Angiostrongylus costaricensis TaxID=334426 RepID=A0A0R3PQC5_ANGCS
KLHFIRKFHLGELLEHCRQYDHPSAIIANVLIVLIRLNQIDAARSIFTKVLIFYFKDSCSSFLSTELLSKLDSFYGVGRQRHRRKFSHKEEKPKLHRIDDEQLFELCEFFLCDKPCFFFLGQFSFSELSSDFQSIDRLVSWSVKNRLEISPEVNKRIVRMKCTAQSGNAVID